MAEVAKVSTARTLSRRLLGRKLKDEFTARDVARKGWTGLGTSTLAEAALSVLEEHGWVVSDDMQEATGRPTTRYYVNPLIHGVKW